MQKKYRQVPAEVLEYEIEWMQKVNAAVALPDQYSWSCDLLIMAESVRRKRSEAKNKPDLKDPEKRDTVLIIAGGAASMTGDSVKQIRPLIYHALEDFKGTVISGGTAIGVPGCVGDIAADLKSAGKNGFNLVGYVTEKFTTDAPEHKAYDNAYKSGLVFSPDHVLRGWKDLYKRHIG